MSLDDYASDNKNRPWWLIASAYTGRIILIVVILGATYYTASYLMSNRPKAKKIRHKQQLLVKTMTLQTVDYRTMVATMGTVVASQQIDLLPQVSGELLTLSPSLIPGGFLQRGELMAQIDPETEQRNVRQAELTLAANKIRLARARHELVVAERNVALGKKQAKVTLQSAQAGAAEAEARFRRIEQLIKSNLRSQEDYDAAKSTDIQKNADLAMARLRTEVVAIEELQLQLKRQEILLAEAQVEQDKVALANAQKRLRDTKILAPFPALVLEKYIGPGSVVTTSTKLATLVAADEYWVEVSVSEDRLPWLTIPHTDEDKGGEARVTGRSWPNGTFRKGYIKRLLPALESQGRMARLLIVIKDPLGREANAGQPPLLLGAFVRVNLEGKKLQQVVRVPRSYLHDGSWVWTINADKLERRQLEIIWRDPDYLYTNGGIAAGEKIVISDVPGAVSGMTVSEAHP